MKYVPCSVRAHLARYIEECRALAIRMGDEDTDLAFQCNEGYLYGVLFSHGRASRKFRGPSWERLVSDYGVRPRDIMTIRLEHYGTWIGIDFIVLVVEMRCLLYRLLVRFIFKEVFSLFYCT